MLRNPTIPYTTVYCPPMTYTFIISQLAVFVKMMRITALRRYVELSMIGNQKIKSDEVRNLSGQTSTSDVPMVIRGEAQAERISTRDIALRWIFQYCDIVIKEKSMISLFPLTGNTGIVIFIQISFGTI